MSEETQTAIPEPKNKRHYKRRQKPVDTGPSQFDLLCRSSALVAQLREALPSAVNTAAVRRALSTIEQAIRKKILADPVQLLAMLGRQQLNGHVTQDNPTTRGGAGREGQAPAPSQSTERIRTVGPESPVISMADLDLFLAEETPGRYYMATLGPREVPILFLSREEYGALRKEIVEGSGDLEGFKRELAKTVPDDLIAPFFTSIMAIYRGTCIKV